MFYTWSGRNLSAFQYADGSCNAYLYNADGIRTSKYYYDADGNVTGTIKYTLDGNKIVAESRNGTNLYYLYDDTGAIMGISYGYDTYTFAKNPQGDVIGIYSGGTLVAKYEYSAYGQILSITNASGVDISNNSSHIANLNPFRYRGYYYDTETGFYYLQTRYYDPVVGRFINRDTSEILTATPTSLTDKNLFAYCDNNPIMRIDQGGQFWDIFFDVGSLVCSIYDVCKNPSDGWAWAGLAGDVVDLVPFVTGVGETVKVSKTANRIVDAVDTVHDTAKTADNVADGVKAGKRIFNISKQNSEVFKGFKPVKGRSYRTLGNGRNKKYYDWDYTHNDIEVYDRSGKHLGSMNPITGEMYKGPVRGREIDI